jgi:putative transposase
VSTLKENLLWVRTFHNVEELRQSLLEFKPDDNGNWIIQRHGNKTPAQARREQSRALPLAARLTSICAQKPVDFHNAL